ncbi:hypothetical protein NDI33_15205 [Trichocoleus sp. DQ-A1]|nr:hypothetical protein [Coleofasciculus sp. FACHB-129]
MDYQTGKLVDTEYSAEEVAIALAGLPVVGWGSGKLISCRPQFCLYYAQCPSPTA